MTYTVQYNSGSGSGYSYEGGFKSFLLAKLWAKENLGDVWWVISHDYSDEQ